MQQRRRHRLSTKRTSGGQTLRGQGGPIPTMPSPAWSARDWKTAVRVGAVGSSVSPGLRHTRVCLLV